MTVGISTVNTANAWLNVLSGTTFTGLTNSYVKLHTGDPGSAGASNASANTTRVVIAWSAASSGSKAITTTLPKWAAWASGTETISHISVWDAITTGNFMYSVALTASKTVTNGDDLTLSSHSISQAPLAA